MWIAPSFYFNQVIKERSGSGSGSQHGPSPFKRPTFQDEQRISQSTKNPLINKETGNIFYKTRLCRKKMQGNCPKGKKCTFAYGLEELHDPPQNWEELVHAKSKRASDNYPKTPGGLILYRYFFAGNECPYGKNCSYLHESPKETEMARSLPMNLSAPII
ncbi:zinc finger CCCH domain-containing protein 39-like [Daucus carota subsp. sativus]|uniref:zinc finger CCCH domain-containing protein 39-like n=1 Tax=Daucus carota subsp. sativus TaxID=79200 RepID=UPI0007EFE9C8|nr:PREDICTED: zinc finger CCCH domain-containing protein 39-like [Daucus carota subsp. sativus]